MVRLFPFLFEALDTTNLALCKVTGYQFVLYDTVKLTEILKQSAQAGGTADVESEWIMPAVASYVEIRPPEPKSGSNCSGAWNITYSVRNPDFPGAAALTVKLASDLIKAPLTSDRESSSSDDAKAMWKRLSADSSMTRVPLDNWRYGGKNGGKQYKDVTPDGVPVPRDGPKTPELEDDCILPPTDTKIGSADAFRSTIDSKPYLVRHKEMIKTAAGFNLGESKLNFRLSSAGFKWFLKLYH